MGALGLSVATALHGPNSPFKFGKLTNQLLKSTQNKGDV